MPKVITQSHFQRASKEGRSWRLNRNGTIADGSVTPQHIMYLLDPVDTTVSIDHIFADAFAGDVTLEIFSNPTIGTPFGALTADDYLTNKRPGQARTQSSTIKLSTTLADVTDFGTPVNKEVLTESTTGSAGKYFSSAGGTEHIDYLDPGQTMLFKITNVGVASTIKFHLEFSEDQD